MTNKQIEAINNLDEQGLRLQISVISTMNIPDKDEIIKYCETRLESLNVDAAMVETGEVKVGEV